MTSRNRWTGSPQLLYALLDGRDRDDSLSPDRSRWYYGNRAPAEEAGAKHRAAWRSNVAVRNQKSIRSF